MKAPGSKDDHLALPEQRLIDDSPCDVILLHGTRPTLGCDTQPPQRQDGVAHQFLGLGRRLKREDAGHSRDLTNVQHPDAGFVR
jgi:hypothetical protein